MVTPETNTGPVGAQAKIGSADNFWLWSPENGFDLSRTQGHDVESSAPLVHLKCEISNVVIDPAKTALIIIDLQNFTLSSALRKDLALPMREAEEVLLKFGIPAARKAKIQIIWLNWGLTDKDLESLPPIYFRNFGWKSNNRDADYGITFRNKGTASADGFVQWGESREATAPGDELGQIALEDGTTIDAGRVLFKDTWNAALHDPLAATFKESQNSPLPDVLFHKNRNSGMCDAMTDCTDYLRHKGIRTLLFCGMNTDQCVLSTLFNAQMKGFDTIVLNDGCATDSPGFAQQNSEYQCCRSWGFLSSCKALADATGSE